MPACCIHKASSKVRKPRWQRGTPAKTREMRAVFDIQAKNETKFTRSFLVLMRSLISKEMKSIIRQALKQSNPTVESILDQIPFFRPGSPETFAIWEKHSRKLETAYSGVIADIASRERRKHGWKSKIETLKADIPVLVPTLPVNPTSVQWIRSRSLSRVVEMSDQERGRVREILTANFEEAQRSELIVNEIANTVGLTNRQWAALQQKLAVANEAGATDAVLAAIHKNEVRRVQLIRARAIARTEIADAHTQGLLDTWRTASEEDELEPEAMKEWVSFEDSRTSQVCIDLDGQTVLVNEQFLWEKTGQTFDGPPAHPNCRSTIVLVFPDSP